MFGFISAREQLVKERQKNAAMQAQIAKANSDIEYLAMLTDIIHLNHIVKKQLLFYLPKEK